MKKVFPFFSLISICLYPNMFMYFQNIGEAQFMDVAPIIGLFLGTSAIILLIIMLIMKDLVSAIFITNIIMLIIINFELIAYAIKWLPHRYICTAACFGMLIICLTVFIMRKKEVAYKLNIIILITFTTLIIINAVSAIPTIIKKVNIEVDKPEILSSINIDDLDTKRAPLPPNIYYLIFDEYGGQENLREYFDYDNQEFLENLSKQGFNISGTSKNEECTATTVIIPNLLNLNYVTDKNMIEEERLTYMKEPELFKLMQYWGYDIVTCSSTPFLDDSMSVKHYENQKFFEAQAGYFVLKNSAFIIFYNRGISLKLLKDKSYGDLLIDAFQYYEDLPYENDFEKARFCIGYFQTPHEPFYFKSDGTLIPQEEHHNWLDYSNYIEYLNWTNGKILEIVDAIIENDRDSIIIIQSDHGARYPNHVTALTEEDLFSAEERAFQFNILNCLYYKGEKVDIEGLSGVNTLRYALDMEFNTNLGMIYNDG